MLISTVGSTLLKIMLQTGATTWMRVDTFGESLAVNQRLTENNMQ
ncbi:hypothetical protein QL982_09210 [Psychrobacter sp. 5A.1]|nr:hypothetical protein [Psychrobacter sp. 5A.1]MDN3502918.1 hypothetical protein [Psychrobacter sp. 5A.1]